MVDILLSTEDLAIFGGPSQIDVSVDYGSQGQRGTFIFTGNGKPTDDDVQFPQAIQPYDLYINLKPSDTEYLFLYQYASVNGVLSWSKVLRLIPNTALANIPVIFYNGEAITFVPEENAPAGPEDIDLSSITQSITAPANPDNQDLWLDLSSIPWTLKVYVAAFSSWVSLGTITPGLKFPIADYFSFSELGTVSASNFNVQYVILNENPIASGLTLGELTEDGSQIFLPISIKASQTQADLTTWSPITGIRTLSFVLTANIGTLNTF